MNGLPYFLIKHDGPSVEQHFSFLILVVFHAVFAASVAVGGEAFADIEGLLVTIVVVGVVGLAGLRVHEGGSAMGVYDKFVRLFGEEAGTDVGLEAEPKGGGLLGGVTRLGDVIRLVHEYSSSEGFVNIIDRLSFQSAAVKDRAVDT